MDVVAYGAKSALCAVLLVAGGAKLADLSGFASTVRLFLPPLRHPLRRSPRTIAASIAIAEIVVAVASISSPELGWLNYVVLVLACLFVAASALGYVFHRNRSCRCFGALSQKRFDLAAVGRGIVLAVLAAGVVADPPESAISTTDQLLLGISALLLAYVAHCAARALNVVRGAYPDLAL